MYIVETSNSTGEFKPYYEYETEEEARDLATRYAETFFGVPVRVVFQGLVLVTYRSVLEIVEPQPKELVAEGRARIKAGSGLTYRSSILQQQGSADGLEGTLFGLVAARCNPHWHFESDNGYFFNVPPDCLEPL